MDDSSGWLLRLPQSALADYAGMTAEQAQGWGWGRATHPDDVKGLVEIGNRLWLRARRLKPKHECVDSTEPIDGSCFARTRCETNRENR